MSGNHTPSDAAREPALNATQAAHCAAMMRYLQGQIEAMGGFMSFERYMDLALYAPALGYYSAGARKFGSGGDFTTAPETSSLFGFCVARQCAEILARLDEAAQNDILEVGAGSGRLAADILHRLDALGRSPRRYRILEISADLRERQLRHLQHAAPQFLDRVQWLEGPPDEPFDGVLLANEVADALPVARFRWSEHGIEELGVRIEAGSLCWAARAAPASMAAHCRRLAAAAGGWEDGYVSEFCPRLSAWAKAVTAPLRRGAVLWFDYGLPRAQYYLPERHEGTLICHYRHQAVADAFARPGLQDITAWVDFTALAEASEDAGFELAGFTTQAHFLAGAGIEQELQTGAGDVAHAARLASEARQLLLPGQMGERFKAMAWTRGVDPDLSGFRLLDLRHSL